MPKGETLGEFEHLALVVIARLLHNAYSMRVPREIVR